MESTAKRHRAGEGLPPVKKEKDTDGVDSAYIELSDSSYESDPSDDEDLPGRGSSKRRNLGAGVVVPEGFLAPLPPTPVPLQVQTQTAASRKAAGISMQFWKAGDFDCLAPVSSDPDIYSSRGLDHVRVHPKFLHSNATSHKWALGAFAELLDNSLDEVSNGATYVNIDMLLNKKDQNRMLLIEDDGGGMDPDKMRQCMSLGYSAKSKVANTIGQYGNGFKTSTMRLGADVIVFSRSRGGCGKRATQSVGLLSYTFLRSTGKEDIIVPMLDYERQGSSWSKLIRSSYDDWRKNLQTITQWCPFSSENDLLRQFSLMEDHGTRIIIYNLWEDDEGLLELDFDSNPHDIQLRGVNREEKDIKMAEEFPNLRHFLTYRHSLRSYSSILYLRVPSNFRIILRGKDVEHHNIVNDMMLSQEVTYRPMPSAAGVYRDDMTAVVTVGFVKDAKQHIDVQGFNVYHKNRLIKPFWRLWNAAGSGGRGVIGVLEANFVEPAHDKQGFERTPVLAKLEARLIQMQKNYWKANCHKIGYAPCRNKNLVNKPAKREKSPECGNKTPLKSDWLASPSSKSTLNGSDKLSTHTSNSGPVGGRKNVARTSESRRRPSVDETSSPSVQNLSDDDLEMDQSEGLQNGTKHVEVGKNDKVGDTETMKDEKKRVWTSSGKTDGETWAELRHELMIEKERCRTLESQLKEAQEKIEQLNKEQETLIEIFQEERERREEEEQKLRRKLREASSTIEDLVNKVRVLESTRPPGDRKSFS
ncbi:hypothetical protein MLD38_026063 [Melastoma candidum]|uniref:Uncharacterized protein n=1 Tax=Melastoma candidum TaxID=119954 RepID=A0ACB9P0K4_9MYRT|nr:hypothetical protein MLD38_026063 [Melastoma candidum]